MKPALINITRLIVVTVIILSLFFPPDSTSLAQGIGFPAEINKRFLPISILPGQISRLKVTVYNPNSFILTDVEWSDNLVGVQPGIFIADPANITHDCGSSAVITAIPGETTLSLEQGEVPAQVGIVPGKCSVEIDVSSITPGNLINTIPAQELKATGGGFDITNTTPASATIRIGVVQPPSLDKTFNPSTIWVGRPSELTITIRNNDPGAALTQTELTDNLPVGVVLANPVSTPLTGCGSSAVLTAIPGESIVKIEGATINANTTCSIKVNVTSLAQGVYTNTIPAQAIQTREGVTNASGTTKNLNVQAVGIIKAFVPTSIPAGGTSTLTITLQNPSAIAYTNAQMVDVLPAAPSPLEYVPGTASTTCGAGTVSIDNPKKLSLSGGTIPASATPASAFGTCIVTVQVTAPISASAAPTNTNTIPVTPIGGDITTNGGLITDQGTNTTAATASLAVQAVSVIKSFNPTSIPAGGSSLLTITLRNPTGTDYTAVKLTDTLPGSVLYYVDDGTQATTCGGSLTITSPSTIVLEGGTIPASPTPPSPPGACTITVKVAAPEGASAASFTNRILPGGLETGQGAKNVGNSDGPLSVYVPGLPPTVVKSFTNSTITIPGGNSRLRIIITAPPDADLAGFQLTDNLPEGMFISNSTAASKSAGCGPSSVLTAVTDTRVVSLTNGAISRATTCQIDVYVSASSSGVYANTITPLDVVYTGAPPILNNVGPINLTVNELSPLTIKKVFYPGSVAPEGLSTLTISLENTNLSPLTNVQLLDTLPGTVSAGVVVAPVPEAFTDCGGGVVTAVPGTLTISMAGGTIPAKVGIVNGLCTIVVNVQGKGANATRTNTIPILNVSAKIGESGPTINPLAPATKDLIITGLTIGVNKKFEPQDVTGGASSTLTVELINPNAVVLTGISFTDNLPTGMIIANPASLDVGTCGGTLTGAPGDELFVFSGGVLPPLTSCALTLKATMTITGNTTNRLEGATPGPSAVTTFNGAKNPFPAQASLTNLPGASVSKFFAPNPIAAGAGNYSLLTITIKNTSSVGLTGMRLEDELVEGISIIGSPAPAPINNCGGTLTAAAGTRLIELAGGNFNGNSQCTIVVPVGGVTPGEFNNLIPPGALITVEQITNSEPAEDDLVLTGTPGMSITKQANVESVRFAGDQIIYTYNLVNTGNLPLANITLVDDNFTSVNPGDDLTPSTRVVI